MKKFFSVISQHKIATGIVVILFFGGSYWVYAHFNGTAQETRYVVATAEKGTIIASISGTGQVATSNQVDLKPRASGDVVSIPVVEGQKVSRGQLIVQLDTRDAAKAIRDAQVNLQNAQISLQKLQKPVDTLSITQSENTLARAQESKQSAQDDLTKSYADSFNSVANTFLDIPAVMAGIQAMLFTKVNSLNDQWYLDYYTDAARHYDIQADTYRKDVSDKFQTARDLYDKNFADYKATTRSADTPVLESLTIETYKTTQSIAEAVKSANNLIQFYKDTMTKYGSPPAGIADTHIATLNTYTGETNSHLTDLLSIQNTIQNDKQTIVNADRTITEDTASLAKLKAGIDPLDIQSAQLTVDQRRNSLVDAQSALADYTVRAPFDGTIAQLNVKKNDTASASTAVATLITQQKIAEISLNEVDAAKVTVGQKVTLTFDAVENLSITGAVASIDTLGTVSQGVVTYAVKITFDTQDERVKPGMSVSASIITDEKTDVVLVPNGAVKAQGTAHYVEMLDQPSSATAADITTAGASVSQGVVSPTPPRRQSVEIGLSDDTMTEIISGLNPGDQVVARTITSASTNTNSSAAPSLFGGGNRGAGGVGGGAGTFRAVGR